MDFYHRAADVDSKKGCDNSGTVTKLLSYSIWGTKGPFYESYKWRKEHHLSWARLQCEPKLYKSEEAVKRLKRRGINYIATSRSRKPMRATLTISTKFQSFILQLLQCCRKAPLSGKILVQCPLPTMLLNGELAYIRRVERKHARSSQEVYDKNSSTTTARTQRCYQHVQRGFVDYISRTVAIGHCRDHRGH